MNHMKTNHLTVSQKELVDLLCLPTNHFIADIKCVNDEYMLRINWEEPKAGSGGWWNAEACPPEVKEVSGVVDVMEKLPGMGCVRPARYVKATDSWICAVSSVKINVSCWRNQTMPDGAVRSEKP